MRHPRTFKPTSSWAARCRPFSLLWLLPRLATAATSTILTFHAGVHGRGRWRGRTKSIIRQPFGSAGREWMRWRAWGSLIGSGLRLRGGCASAAACSTEAVRRRQQGACTSAQPQTWTSLCPDANTPTRAHEPAGLLLPESARCET